MLGMQDYRCKAGSVLMERQWSLVQLCRVSVAGTQGSQRFGERGAVHNWTTARLITTQHTTR